MFVGNFKSREDEKLKKLTQLNYLKVMAENEELNERRNKDYRNPYKPAEIPAPYKTAGERRAESVENEKLAFDNIRSLVDFTTPEIQKVISSIRLSGIAEPIYSFNSYFPQIKTRILKTLNPKLIDPTFFAKQVIDYLRSATRLNPLRYTDEGIMVSSNFSDLMGIYAFDDDIEKFQTTLYGLQQQLNESETALGRRTAERLEVIIEKIGLLETLYFGSEDIAKLKSTLGSAELEIASQLIQTYYTSNKLMDKELLLRFEKGMDEAIENNNEIKATKVATDIIKRINSIDFVKTSAKYKALDDRLEALELITNKEDGAEEAFNKVRTETEKSVADQGEGGQTTQEATQAQAPTAQAPNAGVEESKGAEEKEQQGDLKSLSKDDIVNYVAEIMSEITTDAEALTVIKGIYKQTPGKKMIAELDIQAVKLKHGSYLGFLAELNADTANDLPLEDLKLKLRQLLEIIIRAKVIGAKDYDYKGGEYTTTNPKSLLIKNYPAKKGFGMTRRRVQIGSGNIVKPAVMPNDYQRPHNRADRDKMKKLELMYKVGMEKKKTKPKSITGTGVRVLVPEDTYKTFGKHIVHYPQLRDTNTLNIKYPSKSKNYVPKLVVSTQYKELMIDLLERGNYSDSLLEQLEDIEKEHFHKIVKGAGLMEQFKLKTPPNDKMKQMAERFKLLRGNFLAGNNSPTLIKELRSIVLAFMERNVISKNDGYELLKELGASEK
tara:strand:- start:1846 stop:4008 length:2163 start_codon:yes stop_codon:yes gene_type:complete